LNRLGNVLGVAKVVSVHGCDRSHPSDCRSVAVSSIASWLMQNSSSKIWRGAPKKRLQRWGVHLAT
jgi:hypothetical protein